MSIRVAHLSAYWRSGAVAMIRLHEGLLDQGVQSRVHCVDPVSDSIPNTHSLLRVKPARTEKLLRRIGRTSCSWSRRIQTAAKSNTPFEVFSPPVALTPFDVSEVTRDVDLIHLHWVGGYFDFADFFERVRCPVVWTMHDQNPYLGGFHYQGDVDAAGCMLELEYECRDIKRQTLSKVDLTVIGNSQWNQSLARSTGVLPSSTRVEQIYLPLPIDRYTPQPKIDCKSSLGIPQDRFVVGFACAGLNQRRKGFSDLLAALDRLSPAVKRKTTLLSFGHRPPKGIQENLEIDWRHLGQVSAPEAQSRAYSAMDAFIIPSLEEAFGQTPIEALACGTAVIGTDVGGIPETVVSGRTGLLSPARSPHRLAEQIERLFADAGLRDSLAQAGREQVLRRHESRQIAKQHVQLYQELVNSPANIQIKAA